MSEAETLAMVETQAGGEAAVAAQDLLPGGEASKAEASPPVPSTESAVSEGDLAKAFLSGGEGEEAEAELESAPEAPKDEPKVEGEPETAADDTAKQPADEAKAEPAAMPVTDALASFAQRFGVPIAQAAVARDALVADFNRVMATAGQDQNTTPSAPAQTAAATTTTTPQAQANTPPQTPAPTGDADSAAAIAELQEFFGADSATERLLKTQTEQIKALNDQIAKDREAFQTSAQRAEAARTVEEVIKPFFRELTKDPRLAAIYGVEAPSKQQFGAQVDLVQKATFYQQRKAAEGVSIDSTSALRAAVEAVHADIVKQDAKRVGQAEQRHQARVATPSTAGRTKEPNPDTSARELARSYMKAGRV